MADEISDVTDYIARRIATLDFPSNPDAWDHVLANHERERYRRYAAVAIACIIDVLPDTVTDNGIACQHCGTPYEQWAEVTCLRGGRHRYLTAAV